MGSKTDCAIRISQSLRVTSVTRTMSPTRLRIVEQHGSMNGLVLSAGVLQKGRLNMNADAFDRVSQLMFEAYGFAHVLQCPL